MCNQSKVLEMKMFFPVSIVWLHQYQAFHEELAEVEDFEEENVVLR